MISIVFFQIIVSILIITILHNLYIFFKDNLTTPKVKDLVNKPTEQYKKIYETLNTNSNHANSDTMKDELKNYMKTLSQNSLSQYKTNSIETMPLSYNQNESFTTL